MRAKILKIVFTLVFILVVISGCSNEQELTIPPFEITDEMGDFLGIESETDYNNISAFTDSTTYTTEVEQISITVKNNNPGKGFYFYSVPVVQVQNNNGQWKTLNYATPEYKQWLFCGTEDNTTTPNECCILIKTVYLSDNLKPGNYRVAIYLKQVITYAEFSIH